jgi:alkylglycerol monooxygenase
MEINVYAVLMPALLLLIAGEFVYCMLRRPEYYNFQDSMANLATAIANQVVNVGVGVFIYAGYDALYKRWAPWTMPSTFASWAFLFLSVDFLFYWFHRAGHEINILWAAHSPHHSSEELNYTVGARASLTQRAASFVFYAPLALLGYPAHVLVPAILVHHVLQFWPHTRAIVHLPRWFETVFNAPSHHRVHHGVNDRYLDKNYGGVLIVWDKLFGTFEPESEPVIYGIRPPVASWDIVEINVHVFKKLWAQSKAAPYWVDKIKLWLMPPGWTPRGMPSLVSGWRPESQIKYQTGVSPLARLLLIVQFPLVLGLLLLVTREESPLTGPQKLLAAALTCLATVSWGRLLENGNPWSAAGIWAILGAWRGRTSSPISTRI